MKKKQLLFVIIILLGSIAFAIGLRTLNSAPEHRSKQRFLPKVEYTTIKKEQISFSISSQGTVTTKQFGPISSEVSGRVTALSPEFLNGSFVNKGDVLVSIETTDYDLAVANARAVLIDTQLQLEDKNARYEKDSLSIKQAQAAYQAAKAALAKAQSDLRKTDIRAPYNGIIINKSIELGQLINRGAPISDLIGSDDAEVRLPVNPVDILHIAPNLYSGTIDTEIELTGKIGNQTVTRLADSVRLEGNIDKDTRIFYLTAEIVKPYEQPALPAGLFVTAKIKANPIVEATRLPKQAINRDKTLYLLVDNQIKKQPVTVLYQEEDHVIVTDGLKNGDKVVLTKMDIMFDGMQVSTSDQ